jgi:hypothetical protein
VGTATLKWGERVGIYPFLGKRVGDVPHFSAKEEKTLLLRAVFCHF